METNKINYELKKEIFDYHTDLHKNDRGMGGSIHKRVRERFNLPSDTIVSIINEMEGKDAIKKLPSLLKENEELKLLKNNFDNMLVCSFVVMVFALDKPLPSTMCKPLTSSPLSCQ